MSIIFCGFMFLLFLLCFDLLIDLVYSIQKKKPSDHEEDKISINWFRTCSEASQNQCMPCNKKELGGKKKFVMWWK